MMILQVLPLNVLKNDLISEPDLLGKVSVIPPGDTNAAVRMPSL
jgi:hypothetical protein